MQFCCKKTSFLLVLPLSKKICSHFSLKYSPPEKMKSGGRSCSDAVVGRRAAASELFFLFFFSKIFISKGSTPSPLLDSQFGFSRKGFNLSRSNKQISRTKEKERYTSVSD
jgi:hypothetical protein